MNINFLKFYKYFLLGFIYFSIFVIIWKILSLFVSPIALPSPYNTFLSFKLSWMDGYFLKDFTVSVIRVLIGWAIAVIVGTILGILIGYYKYFKFLEPINDFFRYLPVPAFTPLTLTWFGIGELSKIFLIFLGTIVQILVMVSDEIRRFPGGYIEVGKLFGYSRNDILFEIILRGIRPNLFDIYRVTLGWAWTYLIVGELVAANEGLGFRILKAQRFLQTDLIFSYLFIIGLIGLFSDFLFKSIKPRLFKYLQNSRELT